MKTKIYVRIIESFGYVLTRVNKHLIYSNGTKSIPVPQGREVNRMMARRTLKELGYKEWKNI